jgi:hypothetical protein
MIEHLFVSDSETRKCGRCGRARPIEEFSWRQKGNKRHPYCKPCMAEYNRAHYLANRQAYIDRARIRNQAIIEERVAYLIEYFDSHPCTDCGESDPVVLEFDHLGDKEFTISKGLRDRNWDCVLDEIEKCDVVCANCHRRRTTRRGGFRRAALLARN